MVVMRIQEDGESVCLGIGVAAGELTGDSGRLTVVQPDADVQCIIVVGDAQLGAFRGRLSFVGVALGEVGRRRVLAARPRRRGGRRS